MIAAIPAAKFALSWTKRQMFSDFSLTRRPRNEIRVDSFDRAIDLSPGGIAAKRNRWTLRGSLQQATGELRSSRLDCAITRAGILGISFAHVNAGHVYTIEFERAGG